MPGTYPEERIMCSSQYFNVGYYNHYKSVSSLRKKGDKPYLYAYWRRCLKKLKTKGRLLDVGCGLGFFLKRIEDIYETYGIDVSEYAVKKAKMVASKSKIQIGSAVDLPFKSDSFDIVVAFDVVEHLENPDLFFQKAYKILKKYGILVFSTPNIYSLGAKIKRKRSQNLRGFPYEARKRQWYSWRDDTHISILPCEEWGRLLVKNRFKIIRDGTDTLWDVPYFKYIPSKLQWLFFITLTWVFVWLNGFYPWRWGENYICVARKAEK